LQLLLKGYLPTAVRRPAVVCPLVISRKLSKKDSYLLWSDIELGTADAVAAFRSFPNASFGAVWFQLKYLQILIHDRRYTAGVVSCCKRSATVGTCYSQSSSVVLTTTKSNRRGAASFRSAILFFYTTVPLEGRITH